MSLNNKQKMSIFRLSKAMTHLQLHHKVFLYRIINRNNSLHSDKRNFIVSRGSNRIKIPLHQSKTDDCQDLSYSEFYAWEFLIHPISREGRNYNNFKVKKQDLCLLEITLDQSLLRTRNKKLAIDKRFTKGIFI